MAALVACASLRSYNRDVCVAPFTTRCMLLDERVARSSCSSSQLGSDLPAVTTASGLFPRLPGLPSLSVWVGATNSSAVVLTPRVEGASASICARCWGGNSGDAGSSLDNKRTTPRRASRETPSCASWGTTAKLCSLLKNSRSNKSVRQIGSRRRVTTTKTLQQRCVEPATELGSGQRGVFQQAVCFCGSWLSW